MSGLSRADRRELAALAVSRTLRADLRRLARGRRACLLDAAGGYDPERYLAFVAEVNALIGHRRPPFRPIRLPQARL